MRVVVTRAPNGSHIIIIHGFKERERAVGAGFGFPPDKSHRYWSASRAVSATAQGIPNGAPERAPVLDRSEAVVVRLGDALELHDRYGPTRARRGGSGRWDGRARGGIGGWRAIGWHGYSERARYGNSLT